MGEKQARVARNRPMAKNLGSQQGLIVLSVLHTPSEAEICNFSPL